MAIEVAGGNPQPSYQKCFQFQGEKKKINPGNLPALLCSQTLCDFLYGVHQNMAHSVCPPHPQRSAMSLEPKKVPLLIECACKPSKLWEWVRVRLLLERGDLWLFDRCGSSHQELQAVLQVGKLLPLQKT